jgi:hypothetical protein
MHLRLNGRVFSIGQMGPDFLMLDDPADTPPAEGEITLSIDGRERRWTVRLPAGISATSRETKIAASNGSAVG